MSVPLWEGVFGKVLICLASYSRFLFYFGFYIYIYRAKAFCKGFTSSVTGGRFLSRERSWIQWREVEGMVNFPWKEEDDKLATTERRSR